MTTASDLRENLLALGFDAVRFVSIPPATANAERREITALRNWLDAGRHGDMQWIERGLEKRVNPSLVLEGASTMIVLGVNYFPADNAATPSAPPPLRWARYAQYSDYHDTMKPALEKAGRVLEQSLGLTAADYRYYVDTGPVLERSWAERAGLGFTGKNAMLISRDFGNWLFLAAILVRAKITADEPLMPPDDGEPTERIGLLCGKCTRCIDACPTGAIVSAGVVDSRLCISYQTIENKGPIPRELREKIGTRIYGCDVCAEVCPWNRFAQTSRSLLLDARPEIARLSLGDLLTLTPETFAVHFRKTAIKRVKITGLLRNACVAAGNLGERAKEYLPHLVRLAGHKSSLVRIHAVWAVIKIAGHENAGQLLHEPRTRETDATVLAEYNA